MKWSSLGLVFRAGCLLALMLGAASGCRTVDAENFPCSSSGTCPPGFACGLDQKCHAPGKGPALCVGGDGAVCTGGDGSAGNGDRDGGLGDGRDARDADVASGGDGTGADSRGDAGEAGSDAPTCSSLDAGVECQPVNPCHVGRMVCEDGGNACHDTGELRGDGLSCGAGMVCLLGTCSSCAAGTACDRPGQPCKLGQISCTTGAPVCMESGNATEGMGCGTNLVCSAGQCVACINAAPCVPTANPCHAGALSCAGGVPSCTDLGTNLGDGATCGTNRVCHVGVCGDCTAGAACAVTGKPCRTGAIACDTGQPLCVEVGNVAAGQPCGTNKVCGGGACVDCVANMTCAPTNVCHGGAQSCAAGAPTCGDTGVALANGTTCGVDQVCNAGACASCVATVACVPAGTVCKAGTTTCASGTAVCTPSGNAGNGSPCGTNQVCRDGSCITCVAGASCTPMGAPCHLGHLTCTAGVIACVDDGTAVASGASCGTNLVCNAGSCVACTAGRVCSPGGNVCQSGSTTCTSGSEVCLFTANLMSGTGCGTNMVCSAGSCVACTGGTACTPPNAPCHVGTQSCTTGAPVCNDSGTAAPTGSTCGTNLVCNGGTCVACTAGTACTPPGTVCKLGATSCMSGTQTCAVTTNAADLTPCAAGMVCTSGSCLPIAGCVAGTPKLNCPCTSSGQLACNGARQKLQLICGAVSGMTGLAWSTLGTCVSTSNCDQTDGSCKPILGPCLNQVPGFQFCAAAPAIDVQSSCGTDLVTATSQTCTGVCSGGVCQNPRCGDGKVEAGEVCDDGNAIPVDGCEPVTAPAGVGCTRSRVTALSLGNRHTCALYNGGYVRCWGNNQLGQLGLGHANFEGNKRPFELTDRNGAAAGPIAMGGPVTALSAGQDFTCAVLADQSVRCWGDNSQGQLGFGNATSVVGSTPNDLGPVNVGGAVKAIAAGSVSVCALLVDGSVRCWGNNDTGNLGLGHVTPLSLTMTPMQIGAVSLGATATAISTGDSGSCALLTGGAVRCWGDNFFGGLGVDSTNANLSFSMVPSAYSAVVVPVGRTVTAIASGIGFNCGRLSDSSLLCWGINSSGQLGIGNTTTIGDNEVPAIALLPAAGATSLAIGGGTSVCAQYSNAGGLHCWGFNGKGQLGYADITNRGNTPQNIPSSTLVPAISFGTGLSATSVALGGGHTCVLLNTNDVRCWGQNESGQLGFTVGGVLPVPPNDFFGGVAGQTPDNVMTTVQVLPP